MVLHGYLRTTADLDLVVQLEPENVRWAIRVFQALGFEPRVPVPIETLIARVGEEEVRVLALEDLLEMKRDAGRSQDMADVEALLKLKAPKSRDGREEEP